MRGLVRVWLAQVVNAIAALAFALHLLMAPVQADVLRIETREGPRKAIVLPVRPEPAPTVIVLHGAVTSAGWAARRFGFAEAALARGVAAVFPQAVGLQWNAGRSGLSSKADDVSFLRRLIVELVERGIAEPDRVYIAGISNGGMMALRMVCEAADMLAGAGTVIASMPAGIGSTCRPTRPVPIVMFSGTADRLVPYTGGGVGPLNVGGFVWGTERTAAFLAAANRCGSSPETWDASTERTSVTLLAWTGCARNAGVTLYRVNGGRHDVLGRRRILSALIGARRDDVSAAETIMATFTGE